MSSKEMSEAKVEDLVYISESFPGIPKVNISREGTVQTIEDILDFRGYDVAVVKGEDGYGKTNLLAQFVHQNPHKAINIFIGPSRSQYNPRSIKSDLCNQIHWILENEEIKKKPLSLEEFNVDNLLSDLLRRLNRRCRLEGERYYMVVDGISDIPDKEKYAKEEIYDIIPFDLNNIKTVISGSSNNIPERISKDITIQEIPVSKFSEKETKKYLKDLVKENEAEYIHNICLGIPGRLSIARKIILRHGSASSLLSIESDDLEELLEVEWRDVEEKNISFLVSILCFSNTDIYETELERELVDGKSIDETVHEVSFLELHDDGRVTFTSETFKEYASQKLSHVRSEAREWIIENYKSNANSKRSILNLPSQLHESDRHIELVDYLSAETIFEIVKYGKSTGLAERTAELGLESSQAAERHGDVLRFILHESTVSELTGSQVKATEVEALAALEDYESALALVDEVLSDEERLLLLSVIVREQSLSRGPVDEEVMLRIRSLISSMNEGDLGRNGQQVATNLIHADPELALRLVELSAEAGGGEHSLDVAYLKLSVSAALNSSRNTGEDMPHSEALDSISNHIEDPETRSLSSAANLLMGQYSAEAVISEAKSLDKTDHRLLFLRSWTSSHRRSPEAGKVIEYALKEATRNSDYAQDTGLLRELAEPLPYLDDRDSMRRLVSVFDRQMQASSEVFEESVRLKIILAKAEANYDVSSGLDRLLDLWIEIKSIDDLASRTEGFARLFTALPLTQEQGSLENDLLERITTDLKNSIDKLLETTAEQYEATRKAISALAKGKEELALELSLRLNTEQRRDRALETTLKSMCEEKIQNIDEEIIFTIYSHVESQKYKDNIIKHSVDSLYRSDEVVEDVSLKIEKLMIKIKDMKDMSKRLKTSARALVVIDNCTEESEQIKGDLYEMMESSLEMMNNSCYKITYGYESLKLLANSNSQRVSELKSKVDSIKNEIWLENERGREALIKNINLAIRAFRGLVIDNNYLKEEAELLEHKIKKISSIADKMMLFTRLSFAYYRSGDSDKFNNITSNYLKPIIQDIDSDSPKIHKDAWAYAVACMYLSEPQFTKQRLKSLPREHKDPACVNIIKAISYGVLSNEPYRYVASDLKATPVEDIEKIVDVFGVIEEDSKKYWVVNLISDTITSNNSIKMYDKSYRAELKARLKDKIQKYFPNDDFISHDGFLLLSLADLLRVKDTYSEARPEEWIDLMERANQIPNEADRAYVLSEIADKFPSSRDIDAERRQKMIAKATTTVDEIPSLYDRVRRLKVIGDSARDIDKTKAKQCYKSAIKYLYSEQIDVRTASIGDLKRRVISSAYRLDEEFASSLASLFDDDPAHQKEIRRNINNIKDSKAIINNDGPDRDSNFPQVCWRSLGSMNAGRHSAIKKDRVDELILESKEYTLNRSYPILSLAIEGLVRMYGSKDQANQIIRPIFRATVENLILTENLIVRSSEEQSQAKKQRQTTGSDAIITIQPGQREKAKQELQDWAKRNVKDRLLICDQYFGPADIEAIHLIHSVAPQANFGIITSKKHYLQEGIDDVPSSFRNQWKNKYDQAIPQIRVVIASLENTKKSPVHDRWWIGDSGGLEIGTSFNSIGTDQQSKIRKLSEREFLSKKDDIDNYYYARIRESNDQPIKYEMYDV